MMVKWILALVLGLPPAAPVDTPLEDRAAGDGLAFVALDLGGLRGWAAQQEWIAQSVFQGQDPAILRQQALGMLAGQVGVDMQALDRALRSVRRVGFQFDGFGEDDDMFPVAVRAGK